MQEQITGLEKRVSLLERKAIQINLDPTIKLYLDKAVSDVLLTTPTVTYSTVAPSGTATTGSIWCVDTGNLSTNALYSYSGTSWVQIK